jgi:hypothetical protein
MGDTFTQIPQPVDDRHPGTDQLFQMKREIDDLVTRHALAAELQQAALGAAEIDQIQSQLREPQLEIGEIGCIDGAAHHLALVVHGFVLERGRHPSVLSHE